MRDVQTKETELEATIAEPKDVESDRARIVSLTESEIQDLKKKYAAELVQTRARHRKDEDDCLRGFSDEEASPHPDPSTTLETLLSAQELERSTLRAIQDREIANCRDRGVVRLRLFEEQVEREGVERKRALEQRREALAEEGKELQRREWADWKWMELVEGERRRMLGEDERR
ncbi:MAG: hypothetical protein Q9196_005724, partial [Gyalolechia fulgens]